MSSDIKFHIKRLEESLNFFVSSTEKKIVKRNSFIAKFEVSNKIFFAEYCPPLFSEKDYSFKIQNTLYEFFNNNSFDSNRLYNLAVKFELDPMEFFLDQILYHTQQEQQCFPKEIKSALLYEIDWTKKLDDILNEIRLSDFEVVKFKASFAVFKPLTSLIKLIEKEKLNIKLRIDFNGVLDYENAKSFLRDFSGCPIIDFIEQPTMSIENILKLQNHTSLDIAIDESILDKANFEFYLQNSKKPLIVVKPSLVGGLIFLDKIKNIISNKNGRIIISSNFESPIGFTYVLLCSSLFPNEIHGLDVIKYFSFSDKFKALIPVKGKFDLNKNNFEVIISKFNFFCDM